MTALVSFRRAAQAELIEATEWYEARQSKLGVEFIDEIDRCVALAAEHPLLFGIAHNDIRRVVVNRFPYSIYYRPEAGRIVVLAVFHASRDPSIWHQRV